jgi:hypothetical protein
MNSIEAIPCLMWSVVDPSRDLLSCGSKSSAPVRAITFLASSILSTGPSWPESVLDHSQMAYYLCKGPGSSPSAKYRTALTLLAQK